MKELLETSIFAGVALNLLAYYFGVFLKKKLKLAIFNPILIAIVITIVVLVIEGVDYESYKEESKYLSWFLTPATVCLAIPLYEQTAMLRKNFIAVICGISSGVLTSISTVFILAKIFSFNHREYVTLIPKSITTSIGIGLSEELGGYVNITVAVIVVTGVLGNIIAESVFKVFRIKQPISKGIAAGSGAHVIGTAKAMEIGEVEGAMGSLSIVVAGILTVIAAPFVSNFI